MVAVVPSLDADVYNCSIHHTNPPVKSDVGVHYNVGRGTEEILVQSRVVEGGCNLCLQIGTRPVSDSLDISTRNLLHSSIIPLLPLSTNNQAKSLPQASYLPPAKKLLGVLSASP